MTNTVLAERYAIERQLGQQTGRQTFLARDLQTQQPVAIKVLTFSNNFEWQDLKLFEREAETLKKLSHPSIPRYLDYLELNSPDKKGFALVQSYVEGRTLEDHLKAGRRFSETEVKQLAKSLLEILIYLHGNQPPVIHRDIKPSNILLTNRSGNSVGEVYLVDFGSVQNVAAKEGGTMTVVGTYGYMPPEQFGGRAVAASDLFSLGATFIYLVTGCHPTELPQVDFHIQFQQQAANLDPAFADWLEWMTEPSLDKRLASAQDALGALETPRIRKKAVAMTYIKPANSEVELNKTSEVFELIIPARGFNFVAIAILSISVPISFWIMAILYASSYFVGGVLAIVFVAVIAIALILFCFKQIRLRIDRQKICLINEVFGIKLNGVKPSERQDIWELKLLEEQFDETGETDRVWRKAKLIIRAGKNNYELGQSTRLNETELQWIASELSDWLGLPITK
jgi:serine/threonine protein kinase